MPHSSTSVWFQASDVVGAAEATEVLLTVNILFCCLVPDAQEYRLQRVHLVTFNPTMHITPLSHLLRTFDVIVGHVHSTRVGYLSVDDDNLPVVAMEHMIHPREAQRVEFIDFNAVAAQLFKMPFLQRTVVGGIAEAVEQSPHLNAFTRFPHEYLEQTGSNGVVAEVEIFQMYAAFRLTYGTEHIVEFLLTIHQQRHTVVAGELHTSLTQLPDNKRIARDGIRQRGDAAEYKYKKLS